MRSLPSEEVLNADSLLVLFEALGGFVAGRRKKLKKSNLKNKSPQYIYNEKIG